MALHSLRVQGFKSIRDQLLELGPINIFVGGNGAGKSNLIGIFHFLSSISRQELAIYTGQSGGANAILHYGRRRTANLALRIVFRDSHHENTYALRLVPTAEDGFLFENETTYYRDMNKYEHPYQGHTWVGHTEAQLAKSPGPIAHYIRDHLESYRIYHFHDTSPSAPPKQTCEIEDNRFFRTDASNLAAFLYWLQEKHPGHLRNIEDTVRQIAPFFKRFTLAPSRLNPSKIRLEWEEVGSDMYFSGNALSDGTLRFICLTTLLFQPKLPPIVLIDEPELGLHPAAIQVLAGMLQSASAHTQLLVATQSVTLINQLDPEQVWVVDRVQGESQFRHLKEADMSSWLEEYSLGELWEKNVLGGRP